MVVTWVSILCCYCRNPYYPWVSILHEFQFFIVIASSHTTLGFQFFVVIAASHTTPVVHMLIYYLIALMLKRRWNTCLLKVNSMHTKPFPWHAQLSFTSSRICGFILFESQTEFGFLMVLISFYYVFYICVIDKGGFISLPLYLVCRYLLLLVIHFYLFMYTNFLTIFIQLPITMQFLHPSLTILGVMPRSALR
jgi:hypothetical protein